jgi:hypothetical protein
MGLVASLRLCRRAKATPRKLQSGARAERGQTDRSGSLFSFLAESSARFLFPGSTRGEPAARLCRRPRAVRLALAGHGGARLGCQLPSAILCPV